MYIYTDSTNNIIAMNPNDMGGNTGWEPMPENLTGRTERELFNRLTEEHGIPLYKVEGGVVERTAEEIEADIAALPPAPADPVQAQIDQLTIALLEG